MKIKNSQIIVFITTFLGVYILLAGYLKLTSIESTEISPKTEESNNIISKEESIKTEQIRFKAPSQTAPKALSLEANEINVFLSVLDKNYELEIKENASVFDAMKELQAKTENNFDFKYKEYPGMGVFVYEINGVKGKRGAYWIYYINEKEASVGVSSYILSEGDSILWRQE